MRRTIREQVNKFLEKHGKTHFFLIDSFLFLNIVSFQLDTLDPMILELFQAVRIIRFVQLFKISVCFGDELLSGVESFSSKLFLQIWKQEIVTKSGWMGKQFLAEFIEFGHRCRARVNSCIVLMEEHFLLRQMGTFFL